MKLQLPPPSRGLKAFLERIIRKAVRQADQGQHSVAIQTLAGGEAQQPDEPAEGVEESPGAIQEISSQQVPAGLGILRGPEDHREKLGPIVRAGLDAILPTDVSLKVDLGFESTSKERAEAQERWEQLKIERNAITAFFTSDIWRRAIALSQLMRDQGSDLGLGRKIFDTGTYVSRLEPVSVANITDPARQLREYTQSTLNKAAEEWQQYHSARQANSQTTPTDDDSAYVRFAAIMEFGTHTMRIRADRPVDFIEGGIGTATDTIWSTFEVIPIVFRQKFGREITATEFDAIASSSLPLIMHLAAGNIELAIPLLDALKGYTSMTRPSGQIFFNSQYFMLSDGGGRLSLQVTEDALRTLGDSDGNPISEKPISSNTTGCPAIQAKGKYGKNVIAEMYDWSLSLARAAYFPRFATASPSA